MGSIVTCWDSCEYSEAATVLPVVPFCCLIGVLGAILDLMPCIADQDSSRSCRSLWGRALHPTLSFTRMSSTSPTHSSLTSQSCSDCSWSKFFLVHYIDKSLCLMSFPPTSLPFFFFVNRKGNDSFLFTRLLFIPIHKLPTPLS